MTPEEQKNVASIAITFFDRTEMKGAELQAAMAVRGMLEGIASGEVQLVPVQPTQTGELVNDKG